jgi:cytochrome c2
MILLTLFLQNDPVLQTMGDVKNDMKALEFYLQDKNDKEEFCPKLKWDQPKLKKYKEDPKSYLPKKCKKKDKK